jgi:hypothetical protein
MSKPTIAIKFTDEELRTLGIATNCYEEIVGSAEVELKDAATGQVVERRSSAAPQGTRRDVFSLQEGEVSVQWPSTLSPESLQDIEDWLDILKRKIGRSVAKQSE